MNYKQEITDEQEDDQLDEDEIEALAYNRLMEQGVGTCDPEQIVCEDYEEDEIKTDRDAIDWDTANQEVIKVEEERKQAHLAQIQEQERQRIEQEYMLKQAEEKKREEEMMRQLQEK